MEVKGLGILISDPRGRPLSLSALQVLCLPAGSLQMLPASQGLATPPPPPQPRAHPLRPKAAKLRGC